jgi:hypothetical protein
MYFKFVQNKKQKVLRNCWAIFMYFAISFAVSALCYAIVNLFLSLLVSGFDPISIKYIMIFVALLGLIFLTLVLMYAFTRKGVVINENSITIKLGYFEKFIFYKTEIPINNVVSIEYMENYDFWELQKDYRNCNYRWLSVGMFFKNTPIAKVLLNNNCIYLIPLEDINTFIRTFNNYKND